MSDEHMENLTKAANAAIDAMRQTRILYGIPDTHLLASAEKRLADAMDQVEDQMEDQSIEPEATRCDWCSKARKPSAYAGDDVAHLMLVCQWCRGVETRRNGTAKKPLQGEKKGGTVFEL
jgi:hypothetical protein